MYVRGNHDSVLTAAAVASQPNAVVLEDSETTVQGIDMLSGGTRLMVEGFTGGAGLRGLEGESPTLLSCTVLYLSRISGQLLAYDEITLGGLGQTEVPIMRTVIPPPDGTG